MFDVVQFTCWNGWQK